MVFKREDLIPVETAVDTMPLTKALRILSDCHTRDDDQVGYTVETVASLAFSRWSQAEYIEAWGVVRNAVRHPCDI
jgi:hypothetical protein